MKVTSSETVRSRGRERLLVAVLVALLATFAVVVRDPWAANDRVRGWYDDALDLMGLGGRDYALKLNDFGETVHWDPCSPIYYTVNPLHGPPNWPALVEEAVQATGDASGFELLDVGATDDRDMSPGVRGEGSPVLIAWASADENPGLTGPTAGYSQVATLVDDDRGSEAVAGVVWLDADTYSQMSADGRTDEGVMMLAHELGHVLGLGHVDDNDELMYPRYAGQDGFGSGDKDGFKVLRDQPCPSHAQVTAAVPDQSQVVRR